METIRQKIGPAVRFFFRLNLRRELRRTTRRRDAVQTFWSTEENHSPTTPRAATVFPNITQILRTTARGFDLEEFSVCEIAERATVRRPEWRERAFRAG